MTSSTEGLPASGPDIAADAQGDYPPDTATMRDTARPLLAEDSDPLPTGELDVAISMLRGHMQVLLPDVGKLAGRQPKDDIPRACALACCGEARMRLRLDDGETTAVRTAAARRLARSVMALCDHYENLGGVTV